MLSLRRRQAKNFVALLLLANGTPMFVMGDELLRTQGGNNNPYNQDNGTSWLNYDLRAQNEAHYRFVRLMIDFRKSHPSLGRGRFYRDDIRWFGPHGPVDFSHESRTLAYWLRGATEDDVDLYVMINAFWEPVRFEVQVPATTRLARVVDTTLESPNDIVDPAAGVPLNERAYTVGPRSVVVLRAF